MKTKTSSIIFILLVLILFAAIFSGCTKSQPQGTGFSFYGINKGVKAPDFNLRTIDNKIISLENTKKEQKPVVFIVTSQGCPTCEASLRPLSQIYGDYKDNMEIVVIEIDTYNTPESLSEYLSGKPYENLQYAIASKEFITDYKIITTDIVQLIDKRGISQGISEGIDTLEEWRNLLDSIN